MLIKPNFTSTLLLAAFIMSSLAVAAPPPGGNSGGGQVTLSNFNCAVGEIVRTTDAEEWDCDNGLAVVEDAVTDLNGRVGAIEAEDLGNRMATAEGGITGLDTRVTTNEDAFAVQDGRVTAVEGLLGAVEGQVAEAINDLADHEARLATIEAEDLGIRMTTAEGAITGLDTRVTTNEDAIADQDGRMGALEDADLITRVGDLEQQVFSLELVPGGNYAGVDFGNRSFDPPLAENAFLPGVNFAGARVKNFARFVSTDLRGSNFSGLTDTSFTSWVFENCDLRGSNFSGITAENTKLRFSGSNINGVNLSGLDVGFQGLSISNGDTRSIRLTSSRVENVFIVLGLGDFSDFTGSVWTTQLGTNSNFNAGSCRQCKFNNVDFSNFVTTVGSDFSLAIGHDTEWRDANLAGLRLRGDLQRSDFRGANLQNATIVNGTNLYEALFSGANLSGVTWENVTCPDGTNSADNGGTCEFNLID